jgi:predicted tellurium resistance membrane protein TerC
MKRKPQQSITSLPPSPDADRHARIMRYTVAMVIRLICFVSCFFVQGWWLVAAIVAAIVLPYFAVVLANTGTAKSGDAVIAPGQAMLTDGRADAGDSR